MRPHLVGKRGNRIGTGPKLIMVTPLPAETAQGLRAHYAMVRRRLRDAVAPSMHAVAVEIIPSAIEAAIPAMMTALEAVPQEPGATGFLATFHVPGELALAAEGLSDVQKVHIVLDAMQKLPPGLNRSILRLQRFVSQVFSISMENLKSAGRTADLVKPRQIAMAIAYRLKLGSLPAIGRAFGGRDHTTVLHAVRKKLYLVEEAILNFPEFQMVVLRTQ